MSVLQPELSPSVEPMQVKREKVEDSLTRQAQLESTVASMSEVIIQHKSTLAECKEMLECSLCLENTVSSHVKFLPELFLSFL